MSPQAPSPSAPLCLPPSGQVAPASFPMPAQACDSALEALARLKARQWTTPPRIIIAGSLYLVGEILSLNGTPPE